MRVLHLPSQGNSGVRWWRHDIPVAALKRAGVDVVQFSTEVHGEFEPFFMKEGRSFDVLHVGYASSLDHVQVFAAMRNYSNAHLITDIDDDIKHVPEYNYAFGECHAGSYSRKAVGLNLRISDGVTVTTDALSELYANDAKRIAVLPNCVRVEDWEGTVADPYRADDKAVRVLYAGSLAHLGDLAEIEEVMKWAMARFNGLNGRPYLRLLFMNCVPPWAMQWAQDSEVPEKNQMQLVQSTPYRNFPAVLKWLAPDIYLAPVVKNDFNKGKSHIKAYDAAMTGAAFLATDWPTYEAFLGKGALLVDNSFTQWQGALEALVEDAALRRSLAARLREEVLANWTIDAHIKKWVDFYQSVREEPLVASANDVVRR